MKQPKLKDYKITPKKVDTRTLYNQRSKEHYRNRLKQ